MKELTQNTLVPIGLAIAGIGGGAVWLTTLHWQVSYAHAKLDEVRAMQTQYEKNQQEILREIFRIQGKLGISQAEKGE